MENRGNPVISTAIALALTLAALVGYNYLDPLRLGSLTLKQPKFRAFFSPQLQATSAKPSLARKQPQTPGNTLPDIPPLPLHALDTAPQRILMVGESMIEGLMFPFKKYAAYNGHDLRAKIWYGSRLVDWGASDTLTKLIAAYKPTFIMVSIGSNELFIRHIEERGPFVEKIVQQLEPYNYVWIGPPNPKKDNGINDLIRGYTGDDRFFVSKWMKFPRRRDGVHPKPEGSRKWADSIAVWVMQHSERPILLKRPDSAFLAGAKKPKPVKKQAPKTIAPAKKAKAPSLKIRNKQKPKVIPGPIPLKKAKPIALKKKAAKKAAKPATLKKPAK